jgi:hypothetical protein
MIKRLMVMQKTVIVIWINLFICIYAFCSASYSANCTGNCTGNAVRSTFRGAFIHEINYKTMVLLIKRLHFDYPGKWSYKQGWSYPRGGLVLQIVR